MNRTQEATCDYWLELIIEDSYNEDMSVIEFTQTARLLTDTLTDMREADNAGKR